MKKIFFTSIKGGSGKSSICLLSQSYLVHAGYRVLTIDLDVQNSVSFFFSPFNKSEKNIYRALTTGNAKDNIQNDLFNYWIQSDINLLKLREEKNYLLLKECLHGIESDFDFCLIDSSPTFDGLILMGLYAADIIISPCQVNNFNFKSLCFLLNEMEKHEGIKEKWRIIYNQYRPPVSETSIKKEYNQIFEDNLGEYLLKTYMPTNSIIQKKIDSGSKIKENSPVFESVKRLINELGIKPVKNDFSFI